MRLDAAHPDKALDDHTLADIGRGLYPRTLRVRKEVRVEGGYVRHARLSGRFPLLFVLVSVTESLDLSYPKSTNDFMHGLLSSKVVE